MQYYLVKNSADGTQIRAYSAVSASGQPACDISPGNLELLEAPVATAIEKRRLSDKVFSIGMDFLVSASTKEVFETVNLGDHIVWIPTLLRLKGSGNRDAHYYLIRSKQQYDVVDRVRSEFDYFRTQPTVPMSVKKYVFLEDRLPSEDLFLTAEDDWQWVVTDRLVEAVSRARLTGFKFVPIWSSD